MSEVWVRTRCVLSNFNTLQKGIVLAVSTLFIGLVTGFWGPLLTFSIGLPLTFLGAQRLLQLNRNFDILKHAKQFYKRVRNDMTKLGHVFLPETKAGTENNGISVSETIQNETENHVFSVSDTSSTPELEVNQCLIYVKRDFLHSWYGYISEEELFTEETEELIEQLTMKLMDRVKGVDLLEIIPDYILLIRQHLLDYQEALNKLTMQPNVRYKKDRNREFKKIKTVEAAFAHLGKYHIGAKNNGQFGVEYLRCLMDTIMKVLIPEKTYNCYVPKELLLEIMTCMVLASLVEMFCDKDFLHKAMILILSDEDLLDSLNNGSCQGVDAISEKTEETGLKDETKDKHPLNMNDDQYCTEKPSEKGEKSEKSTANGNGNSEEQVEEVLEGETITSKPESSCQNNQECIDGENTNLQTEVPKTEISTLNVSIHEVNNSPNAPKQTAFVDTLHLAKHFKIAAAETPGSKLQNDSLNSEKDIPQTLGIHIPANHLLQAEGNGSLSSNGSLEDLEGIPTDISFKRSFFIGTDDEETCTSDENASKEGSPALNSGFVPKKVRKHLDFPDGKPLHGSCEMIAANGGETIGDSPLRKAVSCEVLSNQNIVPNPSLQVSASTANLLNVGHPETNNQNLNRFPTPNQLPVGERLPVAQNVKQRPSPEQFVTGPVEANSHDMPNYLYQDVHITSTEQTRDPSRALYTLYVIKYRAWHLEDEMWVLRKSVAKRRYREFVTLQERLEEHPIYKKKIKGIKGPQRWRVIAIGHLENHGIESRRKFLENYLQTLIHRDQVGNSLAMREFLAYEEDAHIAFVKKASEVHVPRIDKIIAKTVSGVFNKITKSTSSNTLDSRSRSSTRLRGTAVPDEVDEADLVDEDAYCLSFGYQHNDQSDVQTMENVLTHHIHQQECLASIDLTTTSDSRPASPTDSVQDEEDEEFKDPIDSQESSDSDQSNSLQGKPADPSKPNQTKRSLEEMTPLASAVLDLALTLVQERDSWVQRDKVIHCLKTLLGQSLESFLREEIEELVTVERWCYYIKLLSSVLWPDGELDTSPTPTLTEQQQNTRREQARSCLAKFFPTFLPYVVGEEDFGMAVDKVMEVIQYKSINRHLVFTLLDNAVETLFPEVQTSRIQQELKTLHIRKDTDS